MCELQIYDFLHPQQEDIKRKSSHPSYDAEIMYATMHDWLINIPPAKGVALFFIKIKQSTQFFASTYHGYLKRSPPHLLYTNKKRLPSGSISPISEGRFRTAIINSYLKGVAPKERRPKVKGRGA